MSIVVACFVCCWLLTCWVGVCSLLLVVCVSLFAVCCYLLSVVGCSLFVACLLVDR